MPELVGHDCEIKPIVFIDLVCKNYVPNDGEVVVNLNHPIIKVIFNV